MSRPPRPLLAVVLLASLLNGCDLLGIESPEKIAAAKDADGRAIGAACRQAGRAIEDCYTINKRADRAAIFAGWRDMNDYMRENKIAEVVPQLSPPGAAVKPMEAKVADAKGMGKDGDADDASPAKSPSDKTKGKSKPAKEAKASSDESAESGS